MPEAGLISFPSNPSEKTPDYTPGVIIKLELPEFLRAKGDV